MQEARSFIVSGAASGIGRHMARMLAGAGHRLLLIDIDGEGVQRLRAEPAFADETRITTRVLDVRDAAGWESVVAEAVERFGRLDAMLNIAGYLLPGYIHEIDVDVLDRHVDINAKGVMYATRAAARRMIEQGEGHIVNVASIAGISPVPGLAAYAASKHAVRGFTLSVAHELRPHGIDVSVVCPDAVETPMLELQVGYEEAALTFGAGRGLTLREVERALLEVLERRPLEQVIAVPRSGRGVGAKLGGAFPAASRRVLGWVRAQGRKAQRRRGSRG